MQSLKQRLSHISPGGCFSVSPRARFNWIWTIQTWPAPCSLSLLVASPSTRSLSSAVCVVSHSWFHPESSIETLNWPRWRLRFSTSCDRRTYSTGKASQPTGTASSVAKQSAELLSASRFASVLRGARQPALPTPSPRCDRHRKSTLPSDLTGQQTGGTFSAFLIAATLVGGIVSAS